MSGSGSAAVYLAATVGSRGEGGGGGEVGAGGGGERRKKEKGPTVGAVGVA